MAGRCKPGDFFSTLRQGIALPIRISIHLADHIRQVIDGIVQQMPVNTL